MKCLLKIKSRSRSSSSADSLRHLHRYAKSLNRFDDLNAHIGNAERQAFDG